MTDDVFDLLPARKGHFVLESGHHGDLWLDLELLCLQPGPVRRLAGELAGGLAGFDVEVVCGPLVEGAFVALMVAEALGVPFVYSERLVAAEGRAALYPVRYAVPRNLRDEIRGRRVAIVNDVINAGSAVRGTFIDLQAGGAFPRAIGALAVLGDWAATFAADNRLDLASLTSLGNEVWPPARCPLCARDVPLTEPPDTRDRPDEPAGRRPTPFWRT